MANFRINSHPRYEIDAPYDFHSVIHYNSHAFSSYFNSPTILSKIPALDSDQNEINHPRDKLTPIDIFKIQSLYKCNTLTIPSIIKSADSIEEEKMEKISARLRIEARFNGVSDDLVEKYLEKTYDTCGVDHYWPPDYPLVESEHRLYKLMCLPKKTTYERCRFSIECQDEDAVCFRFLVRKKGHCVRFENDKVHRVVQKINDKSYELGFTVKSALSNFINKNFKGTK